MENKEYHSRMTFPPYISLIFRGVAFISIGFDITYRLEMIYNFGHELPNPPWGYLLVLKILICFTAFISYLNERGEMLVIFNKGVVIENINNRDKKSKYSFLFLIIIAIYNPLIGFFHMNVLCIIIDALTVLFAILRFKKQIKEEE